jgi:cell division protease FtsH
MPAGVEDHRRPRRALARADETADRTLPRDERGWRVAPAPDGRGAPPPPPGGRRRLRPGRFGWVVLALLALNWVPVLLLTTSSHQPRVAIPFNPVFLQDVQAGRVKSISSTDDTIHGTFTSAQRYPATSRSATPTALFSTQVPTFWNGDQLSALLESKGVQITAANPAAGPSVLTQLLLGFGPTLLIVGLLVLFARRAGGAGGMGALSAFGRSKARRVDRDTILVTFDDVAGIDEAKAELSEIVDFLRDPGRYRRLGGRMPHGVLLSGAPGTGKTLLARAVAGEAHAAFFSISASEFIEAIVGVGASRVRDLFAQAKAAAPSIIFIDELDAIGRSRDARPGLAGGNDEREQTLDQILTEMDGFDTSEAVVVLGATNRADVLDAALLRPGRFDRRVAVQAPDREGRRRILEVHTRPLPLADDVDLAAIASSTPGMVGADLANLANEAALLGARRHHDRVETSDFTDSLEKILLGAPRGIVLSPQDRWRTAHHESGHALVAMLTPGADPVRKVSIIPRGAALGVTLSAPDADRVFYSREDLEARIRVALGGRVAEELTFGTITTGAESDIRQLTEIARDMVGRWGMSEHVGPITVLPDDGSALGLGGMGARSEDMQRLIDEEVRRLVDDANTDVTQLLTVHSDQLRSLAEALLEAETLDAVDAYAAAGVPARAAQLERPGTPQS